MSSIFNERFEKERNRMKKQVITMMVVSVVGILFLSFFVAHTIVTEVNSCGGTITKCFAKQVKEFKEELK